MSPLTKGRMSHNGCDPLGRTHHYANTPLQGIRAPPDRSRSREHAAPPPVPRHRLRDIAGRVRGPGPAPSHAVRDLDEAALVALSKGMGLALSGTEMLTIQNHYRSLRREPADVDDQV